MNGSLKHLHSWAPQKNRSPYLRMHAGFGRFLMLHALYSKIQKKHVKFYKHCRTTAAWKSSENFRFTLQKNYAFFMQYTNFFANFCYNSQNFIFQNKSVENLFWYFYKIFHAAWKIFHARYSLFIITCNQKKSCGYNLFISRTSFLLWLLKSSSPAIFYYNVKTWFSKEFLSKFSWVQWNVDENKWIELSKRQSSN